MTTRLNEYARRAKKGFWGELRAWLPMAVLITGMLYYQNQQIEAEQAQLEADRALAAGPPLVVADLEVARTGDTIGVNYRARACSQDIHARWRATVRTGDGIRLSTRRGDGDYLFRHCDAALRFWPWQAFFEGDTSTAPQVPQVPFRVCVSYRAQISDDVEQLTRETCSGVFDPNEEAD